MLGAVWHGSASVLLPASNLSLLWILNRYIVITLSSPSSPLAFIPGALFFAGTTPPPLWLSIGINSRMALLLVVNVNKASYAYPLMFVAGGCHVFRNPFCILIRTPQISEVPSIISFLKSPFLCLIYILSRLMWWSDPGKLSILGSDPDVSSDLGFERIRPHYGKWSKLILPCSLCSPVIFSCGSKKHSLIPHNP